MNQEKIGDFIMQVRKERKLTQKMLAEKLGVSDKTISNWERGKYMPDYSLVLPLCKNLNITVDELLSGQKKEIIDTDGAIEGVISLVNHNKKGTKLGYIIILVGLSFSIYSLTFMTQILNAGLGLFSLLGLIISFYGYVLISRNYKTKRKIIFGILFVLAYILILIFFDLIGIINYNDNSKFSYNVGIKGDMKLSQSIFYDLVDCDGSGYKIIFHKYNNYNNIEKKCKNIK